MSKIERKEFICPECGSDRWGSSHVTEPYEEWTGHCHGFGCKFTWDRKKDDCNFFKGTGEFEDRIVKGFSDLEVD